jgi:hypothetical protein
MWDENRALTSMSLFLIIGIKQKSDTAYSTVVDVVITMHQYSHARRHCTGARDMIHEMLSAQT